MQKLMERYLAIEAMLPCVSREHVHILYFEMNYILDSIRNENKRWLANRGVIVEE